ncbi:uncharacterized protein MONOS_14876 [Monocercomonoides exilis]|uniref:uncharacterized protein n=1 Tax=Monocercomonoides exilis TaxID=2049356 RepID=UPI0035595CD5|nr:hypothetical protein MONOS_14876 [Monocercomonoides exilis]|eukprot:MONOS_14876.1-p1 / transcript=MONOS_14876.1 / gene=MONOS_14876 / organism=Monocercomonoides_exilis_PA203 / gene_product=unspecified product / transcript_product=unspecified product / location=Mono_scaffold01094:15253-15996(-) / protein_length=88 / sequence_SO=supercontig / SO=protein_coding / is_pseudo=false
MVVVPNRNKETLLAAIKEHISPHTTIYSDEWKACNCLDEEVEMVAEEDENDPEKAFEEEEIPDMDDLPDDDTDFGADDGADVSVWSDD